MQISRLSALGTLKFQKADVFIKAKRINQLKLYNISAIIKTYLFTFSQTSKWVLNKNETHSSIEALINLVLCVFCAKDVKRKCDISIILLACVIYMHDLNKKFFKGRLRSETSSSSNCVPIGGKFLLPEFLINDTTLRVWIQLTNAQKKQPIQRKYISL